MKNKKKELRGWNVFSKKKREKKEEKVEEQKKYIIFSNCVLFGE